MNEDYVSLEVARLLKEKGFDSHYSTHFYKNNKLECYIEDRKKYWLQKDEYAAPTLYMAQKWLIEKKGLHVSTGFNVPTGRWFYIIMNIREGHYQGKGLSDYEYSFFEEALQAGILDALNLI